MLLNLGEREHAVFVAKWGQITFCMRLKIEEVRAAIRDAL